MQVIGLFRNFVGKCCVTTIRRAYTEVMENTQNTQLTKRFGRDGSLIGSTYRGVRLVSVSARSVVYGCRCGYSFAQTTQPMSTKRALVAIDEDIARGMTVVDGNLL